MSNYELWAKHKDKSFYEKICEFDNKREIESRIDELLATEEYLEATILREHQYIYGKEYKGNKKHLIKK